MGIIGYNTVASSSVFRDSSEIAYWDVAGEYTPAQDETLDEAFIYIKQEPSQVETFEMGCYRVSDGVLMEKVSFSVPTGSGESWKSAAFSGATTLSAGTAYRVAIAWGPGTGIGVKRDTLFGDGGGDASITGNTGLTSPFIQDTTINYRYSAYLTTSAAVTLSLTSVPATAFPSQSRTVTGTGFGATQGTGGVTIGGVAQTVTSWSDTSITFTTVQGNNKYEAGKTLEVTTNAAETVSDTIELVADTANGFGYVDISSPNTTDESSVAFNTTPTVVTGDQFEWEDFNNLGNLTVDAQGFVTNVDTEGTFRGRFWDATDSTWGAVENFTASVPGEEDTWPFGKGINPAATKNWTWGRRHPKTNMRVRIYK